MSINSYKPDHSDNLILIVPVLLLIGNFKVDKVVLYKVRQHGDGKDEDEAPGEHRTGDASLGVHRDLGGVLVQGLGIEIVHSGHLSSPLSDIIDYLYYDLGLFSIISIIFLPCCR